MDVDAPNSPAFNAGILMQALLHEYEVNHATWFYLSLLLIVAVYFRFNRLWSLRNLDLALLLSFAPGFLFLAERPDLGNAWLFTVSGLILVRMFCDSLFARRPRMEQNLNRPGLAFLGVAAFAFLMTSVLTKPVPEAAAETVRRGSQIRKGEGVVTPAETADAAGPASALLTAPVDGLVEAVTVSNGTHRLVPGGVESITARVMAILSHLAVVAGLFVMAQRHFGDPGLGVAMGALYLLLPCTAFAAGEVNHVLPAALIVWALVFYRRPVAAGVLLGLACGTLFFPVFLLPLWMVYFGRRSVLRFATAWAVVAAGLLGGVVLVSGSAEVFLRQTIGWINWSGLEFHAGQGDGFWSTHNAAYRVPVFAGFLIMLVLLTVWPRQKSLEQLLAHSTAIVIGTQYWYPQQGGVYLLWYLPLLLLVVFRPRLAVSALSSRGAGVTSVTTTPPHPRQELVGAGAPGHSFLR